MPDIVQQLIDALGRDCVLTQDEAAQRPAGVWGAAGHLTALALVRPNTTEQVATALRICHEAGQPVVPHGGLSGVVYGTTTRPSEIALSLERMNAIEEIDETNKTATVQAGVILQHLREAAARQGLLFPLDLGAKGSCMIGGNIATNAGGVQALRYGVTRQLVRGLEVVLADGTVLTSLDKMIKNNAGYDLKQLFIGSEGTLGVITRAVVKLEDAPKTRQTAFIGLTSFDQAARFLTFAKRVLPNSLTTFELLWQNYYRLMTSAPSPYAPPLPQSYPYYVLLESQGQHETTDPAQFESMLETALETGLIADAVLAQTQKELDWFWGIREFVEFIFTVHSPVFLFDVSLPIASMDAYITDLQTRLTQVWPQALCYVFGHMGDGNLHLFVSCGQNDHQTRHRVEQLVYAPLRAIGGSISAEHGIGLEKRNWLHVSRSEAEINLMKTIKQALDPKGILNPGKLLPE